MSRSRGTTTWQHRPRRADRRPRDRGRSRRPRRALSRRDPGAPRLGDRPLLAVGRRPDDPTAGRRSRPVSRRRVHHLSTFWAVRDRPNVVLFHYDELKADLEGQMRRLAAHLGISVPEERWPELVDAATFERMQRGRRSDRARHDARDLAGQPAVLPPRRQRPVARAARRRRSSPLQRASCRAGRSRPRPLVAPRIAAGALTDPPISARDHWEGQADDWIELTRSDPQYELLNKPSFLELVPAPGRLHDRGRLRRRPRRPRAPRARPPRARLRRRARARPGRGRSPRRPTGRRRRHRSLADRNGGRRHRRVLHGAHGHRRPRRRGRGARSRARTRRHAVRRDPAPDHHERPLRTRRRVRHVLHGRIPEDDATRARHRTERRRDLSPPGGAPADRALLPRVRSRGPRRHCLARAPPERRA